MDEEIRTEEIKICFLCNREGEELYTGLPDGLFGAPGKYGFRICRDCEVVWQSPRPVKEDIWKCYKTYYTHKPPPPSPPRIRKFGGLRDMIRNAMLSEIWGYKHLKVDKWWTPMVARFLYLIPPLKERARFKMGDLFLPFTGEGRLLEIGCGTGRYLARMKKMGWKVKGIEMDKEACRVARTEYGIDVIEGDAESIDFGEKTFDAIVMVHVIEHLFRPIKVLEKCYNALTGGGILVISTPNIRSFGHRVFKDSWVGLDPPRHLYLFSLYSLSNLLIRSGFKIIKGYTHSKSFFFFQESLKLKGEIIEKKAMNLWKKGKLMNMFAKNSGEEILIIGRKDGKN